MYRMKIKNIALMIACMLAYACYIHISKQPSSNNDTLVVGIASGYAPFVSVNQSGDYEGFDIDVAHALADQLGKKLVLKDLGSMTSLFMALEQGTIDVIAWGLSITQERLEKVAMIHYQGAVTDAYPLIFWKQIPEGVTTLDDMSGRTICVEPTSAQDVILDSYPTITKLSTEKVDDALLNIQYNKAVAALVEPAIAEKFKNKYPEIQILNVSLPEQDKPQGIGLVVKKNNASCIQALHDAVTALKTAGIIEQLEKKWNVPS